MNENLAWEFAVSKELTQAESARASGNEGMARVCARRAAGIIIGEYLSQRGLPIPGPSAHDRLKYLGEIPEISPKAREISTHLLTRVNTDFTLPLDVDLIQETRVLAEELLGKYN